MQNQDFSYLYTEAERARFDWCRREQENWNYRPLISIVVPVPQNARCGCWTR